MTELFDNVLDNFKNRMDEIRIEIDPDCLFFKTINDISISAVYELFEVDKGTLEGLESLSDFYNNIQDDLYFHVWDIRIVADENPGSKDLVKLCKFMYLVETKMKAIDIKITLINTDIIDKTERLKNIDEHIKFINKEIKTLALELN